MVRGWPAIDSSKDPKVQCASTPREAIDSCGAFTFIDRISFRPMTLADLDEVMAIERASFAYPWSSRFFHQEFEVECARSILAEMNGKIVGYVLFWLLPESVDIHNLAVSREYRRRGLGRVLLHKVIGEALRQSRSRVTLEVRKSNLAAQKLYESAGFIATGIRKGYYSDDGEDAFTMTLELAIANAS